MKTLDQVEPRTIVNALNTPGDAKSMFVLSQPGSYYLIENLVGSQERNGISVRADGVTLDLNGFALLGEAAGTMRGVDVPMPCHGFALSNGTVMGWPGGGVMAAAAVMRAQGLLLTGNIGAVGLTAGNGSLVQGCVASANGTGFSLADRTSILESIATVNSQVGIMATSYVSILDCTCSRNGWAGVTAEAACVIARCSATRNLPDGYGIRAGEGCTVTDCTGSRNGSDGISVGAGSSVQNCTASGNGARGIRASNGGCYLSDNTANGNDTGIVAESSPAQLGSRLDGNTCASNRSSGYVVNGRRNLVVRNSAAGNGGAFSISPGNVVGPVLDLTGGGSLAAASGWANVIH